MTQLSDETQPLGLHKEGCGLRGSNFLPGFPVAPLAHSSTLALWIGRWRHARALSRGVFYKWSGEGHQLFIRPLLYDRESSRALPSCSLTVSEKADEGWFTDALSRYLLWNRAFSPQLLFLKEVVPFWVAHSSRLTDIK